MREKTLAFPSTKVKGLNPSANFLIWNRFHVTLTIFSPTFVLIKNQTETEKTDSGVW